MQHYWRHVFLLCVLFCSASVVQGKHSKDHAPEQIHLSFGTADCTAVTISWVSLEQTESFALYGTGEDLDNETTGSSRRYTYHKTEEYTRFVLNLIILKCFMTLQAEVLKVKLLLLSRANCILLCQYAVLHDTCTALSCTLQRLQTWLQALSTSTKLVTRS
jgi:hypothetical protein